MRRWSALPRSSAVWTANRCRRASQHKPLPMILYLIVMQCCSMSALICAMSGLPALLFFLLAMCVVWRWCQTLRTCTRCAGRLGMWSAC